MISIVITQLPFAVTIVLSFQQWNLLRPDRRGFVGFDNYIEALTRGGFLSSLGSTVLITGASVITSAVLGLLLAVLLDRRFLGRGTARTLLITPFLIMPAAAALLWKWLMLDSTNGLVSWVLSLLGADPIAWVTDLPVVTIIMVLVWQYTPFMMLILLSGLQSQAPEVLESAAVDGAGPFRTFWFITLPHMRQYLELAMLLGTILMSQVFDPVQIITKGTGGTKTLPYLLYERAFGGLEIGAAAALGVLTVIVTIIVATVTLRLLFSIFTSQGARA
ncbi:carbohydrate ABC transporter permease [Pseudonocardia sp. MH-G8]|uniref:carbohydrate ABC transporter permease n=1 Tax=Pseudonocardia sp. MH-G8 TaxID=1854588 RepID=UPI001E5C4F1C|nr:sugar ABC transporter permease [Pseudonocardia sp. MH-G8]